MTVTKNSKSVLFRAKRNLSITSLVLASISVFYIVVYSAVSICWFMLGNLGYPIGALYKSYIVFVIISLVLFCLLLIGLFCFAAFYNPLKKFNQELASKINIVSIILIIAILVEFFVFIIRFLPAFFTSILPLPHILRVFSGILFMLSFYLIFDVERDFYNKGKYSEKPTPFLFISGIMFFMIYVVQLIIFSINIPLKNNLSLALALTYTVLLYGSFAAGMLFFKSSLSSLKESDGRIYEYTGGSI